MGRAIPSPAGLRATGKGAVIGMAYVEGGVRARAYCGAVGTGKTQRLVDECVRLVQAGDGEGTLVLAASASAAEALRARLGQAGAGSVRVTTPMGWALGLLCTPQATAFTGREAHVLNDYEQDFFFEDMRVLGTKQHRLREMLKFFFRGWSEMHEDEPDWLVTVEEKDVNRLAKADLAMMRAYHPCEVSAAAVRYLASDADALAVARVAHVLVDDFRAMSRASQRLCEMLAGESLSVAWDDVASLVGEEPYGYAEGLQELAGQCDLECVRLSTFQGSPVAYAALSNLYRQECVTAELPEKGRAGEGEIVVRTAGMLDKEPAYVVEEVRKALDEGVAPEDVFVAAGRSSWVARMRSALEDAGIPASWAEDRECLRGDIRDPERCADMAMANALRLAADPRNCLAWRCWCGFGDYLCHSAAFADLSHVLENAPQVTLCDLLSGLIGEGDLVVGGDMLDRPRVEERVRAGKSMLAEAEGLTGQALLDVLHRHVCAAGQRTDAFDALLGDVAPTDGAGALLARVDAAFQPQAPKPGCVRVGLFDALLGQTPRVLVLCGLTNGLYPEKGYFDLLQKTIEDQDKMHARLIDQLVEVAGKAGERLVLTSFAHADILDAEPMKLMSERIRLRNGHRMCEFAPSAVIDYLTGAKTAYVR